MRLHTKIGCRYLRIGSATSGQPVRMAASNDRVAVRVAVEYLFAAGHRRSGLVAGPHGFRLARERRQGFEEALGDADIALPRSLVVEGSYCFGSGLAAGKRLPDLAP